MLVADIGNTRLKWASLHPDGSLGDVDAVLVESDDSWAEAARRWQELAPKARWAVASVNPPAAARLERLIESSGGSVDVWCRSAADVPVKNTLAAPASTGADRALAVLAAIKIGARGCPGLVVLCGTAITVERVESDGTWQGGAIAVGMGLAAHSLHLETAQLPWVRRHGIPPAWGGATEPALAAGVFWGSVGTVRELIAQQSKGWTQEPWVLWTGGDAQALALPVQAQRACVVPDLVLRGLAGLACVTWDRADQA
jgi:type III pantothenate kinase